MESRVERLINLNQTINFSWINKRCRQLVFSVLERIEGGVIEVQEGSQCYTFGCGQVTNSQRPNLQARIVILDANAYVDFVKDGSIGAAQSYIDNKWQSDDLTKVIRLFARSQKLIDNLDRGKSLFAKIKQSLFHRRNRNSQSGSKKNILAHYDLGNELYERFLDSRMIYSSAIYPDEQASLEQAQQHKLDVICQKLELDENDHLLEIGTGWGGLAIYAAQQYGCKVTTTTISDAQHEYTAQLIDKLGLQQRITLLKKDYRDLTGTYDKLVSIEMIEAVGYEFMDGFFKQCNARLKNDGKMLIQAITIADQRFDYYLHNVDFIQRYIFPGGFLPSVSLITQQFKDNTTMVIEGLNDIGLDYAKTLADWRSAFLHSWQDLTQFGYDETFRRLWLYYFAYCEGAFLERSTSTVQVVARK